MNLKDTISKWHTAICFLEQDQPKQAMQRLKEIQNPSAKIVYNLGCISMYMELYKDAIEYFNSSVEQDKYLAISYFQRGICHYRKRSYALAEKDFEVAKSMVPKEGIDYRQLGAKVILYCNTIDGFYRSCRHCSDTNMSTPLLTSCLDFVFYPPKKMVANLKKEDFLGKAKVISSVEESDILYAEAKGFPPKKNGGINVSSPTSNLQQLPRNSIALQSKFAFAPSRPPPRLGRSRSLSDLLGDNEDEKLSSSSTASSLAVPRDGDHSQNRRSTSDYDDMQFSSYDQTDSFSSYARLSVSSSALDNKPRRKPPVPKRPIRAKENTKDISVKPHLSPSSGFEFQKIQETLKGKLRQNKDSEIENSQMVKQKSAVDNNGNKLKPFRIKYDDKDHEKLVPPKRIMVHGSQPNLPTLALPKDNTAGKATKMTQEDDCIKKKKSPPARPCPPFAVPTKSLDPTSKPTKPPPRPKNV